jgi:hypothetical protein
MINSDGDQLHSPQFLPNIGRLVAGRLDGSLEPELVKKFSFGRTATTEGVEREGQTPRLLREENLSTLEDLRTV